MTLILDINDTGLRLFRGQDLLQVSPGFVTVLNKTAATGHEAQQQARRHPIQTESRFWDQFSQDRLAQPNRLALTHADLAYHHLNALSADIGDAPVALAVPGDWSTEQLGLIAGICQALNWNLAAMVDQAIAAADRPYPGRQLFYLDLHLHRAVLTALEQGQQLIRQQVVSSREMGLTRLREACAEAITRLFIQRTRFDPLHDAEVEQQLHDKLETWLDEVQHSDSLELELTQHDNRFTTRLNLDQVINAARPHYRRLARFLNANLPADRPCTLLVSQRMARLPGMMARLTALPQTDVVIAAEDAVAVGAAEAIANAGADGPITHILHRPWLQDTDLEAHQSRLRAFHREQPTHILYRNRAYPLSRQGLWIGNGSADISLGEGIADVDERHCRLSLNAGQAVITDASDGKTRINRQPLEGELEVGVGDRIGIGRPQVELLLIRVEGS